MPTSQDELNILAAGDAVALLHLQALLDVLGRYACLLGDHPAGAHAAKIACYMMMVDYSLANNTSAKVRLRPTSHRWP